MNKCSYSASENAFYINEAKEAYVANKKWPTDAIDIDDAIFNEYSQEPPEGKMRIAGKNGLPDWADIPPAPARDPDIEFNNVYEAQDFIRAADSAMIKALSTAVFDVLKVDISDVQENISQGVSALGISKSRNSEAIDIQEIISKRNRAEAFIQTEIDTKLKESQGATS